MKHLKSGMLVQCQDLDLRPSYGKPGLVLERRRDRRNGMDRTVYNVLVGDKVEQFTRDCLQEDPECKACNRYKTLNDLGIGCAAGLFTD
jgi:hypothetical protein